MMLKKLVIFIGILSVAGACCISTCYTAEFTNFVEEDIGGTFTNGSFIIEDTPFLTQSYWIKESGIWNFYVKAGETVYKNAVSGATLPLTITSTGFAGFTGTIKDIKLYSEAKSAAWVESKYSYQGLAIIKFQIAGSVDGGTWTDFIGPDGTTDSYFFASNTSIPSSLAGYRYLKYKAYFATADGAYTPSLNDVRLTFSDDVEADRVVSDESDNVFTIQPSTITVADVEPQSLVVGAMGDVDVSFTTINTIPADGKIVVTFPSGFTLDSEGSVTASSATIDGTLAVGTSGQVVTITRSGGTEQAKASAEVITLTYIKNQPDTGSTGTYILKTTTSDDKTIDQKTDVAANTITNGGSLTNTNVEPATRYAGVVEDVTVSFTTANPIPADGKIVVTFPAGFVLSSGAATAASSVGIDGTFAVSVDAVNRIATITRSGGTQQSATAEVITLTNIKNPTSGGTTGTYKIQTASSSGVSTGLIDQDTAVSADHIIGSLVSPAVTPASTPTQAGATPNYTISFTTVTLVPVSGTIEVDFNTDYDLSGTLAVASGNPSATAAASNQTLVITLGTGINAASASGNIVISGIKNPVLLGTTGTYAIRTKNASGALVDDGTAAANTIAIPTLTLLTPSAAGITLDTEQSYAVTWSYDGTISDNMSLYYSTDSGTSYPNTIAIGEANDGTYAWSVVPYDPSTTAKVKVQDTFYQALSETTDAHFGAGDASNISVSGSGNSAGLKLEDYSSSFSPITITDNTGAITAVNDIRIRIPSTFNMTWNTLYTTAVITGGALAKVSTGVSYEGSNKVLALDVTADFVAGDTIVISGLGFNNFSAVSAADKLELDIYNTGAVHITDSKYIEIKTSSSAPFIGGAGDGWDYKQSGDFSLQ